MAGNKQRKQGGLIEIVSGESKVAPLIGAFEGSVGGVVIANGNYYLGVCKMASLRTVFCKDLFAGKVAVVTGGGSGIGKAITTELARLGCKVVIASRKAERLQESAKEINHRISNEVGGAVETPRPHLERVYPFQCNIRQEDQVCYRHFHIW